MPAPSLCDSAGHNINRQCAPGGHKSRFRGVNNCKKALHYSYLIALYGFCQYSKIRIPEIRSFYRGGGSSRTDIHRLYLNAIGRLCG